MSSKKEKLIESATRFIVKGQIDRAIKEYEQLVALEPGDVRNRQKLAELLVRENRKAEAIAEFTNVAQFYVKNSFYLKAIAVYKQIRKLDPDNPAIALTLADLNLKQGMTGNAMAEFSDALAIYTRLGDLGQVQRVLTLMQEADPGNTGLMLKNAELLVSMGRMDEAFNLFLDLMVSMEMQGKEIGSSQLEQRIRELFPAGRLYLALARRFKDEGDLRRAESYARKAVEAARDSAEPWHLLLDCIGETRDEETFSALCEEMIRHFPNDPLPRERLIERKLDSFRTDDALRLIESSTIVFRNASRIDFLIDAYRRLSALMPGDRRPLLPLRDLLRETGNPLLSGIEAELAALADDGSRITIAPPLPEDSRAEETLPDETLSDDEFGEEIDLSEFEGVVGAESSEPVALPLEENDSAEDFSVDWESEGLDLGEIELMPAIPREAGPVAPSPEPPRPRRQNRVKLGEEVDAGDVATIYDLAIAYKEMGLYDEAIDQFEIVARDPRRRVDSMTLQGVCHREKGDQQSAENVFLKVLTLPASRHERLCALYELAEIYLEQGKQSEALKLFREIYETDPEYREVSGYLQRLSDQGSGYMSDQLIDLVREHT